MYKKFGEHLAEMQLKYQIGFDAFSISFYARHKTAYCRENLSLGHEYPWSNFFEWLSSFLRLSVICNLFFSFPRFEQVDARI
jgi:hypothetical protein